MKNEVVRIRKLKPEEWLQYRRLRREAARHEPRNLAITYGEERRSDAAQLQDDVKLAWQNRGKWILVANVPGAIRPIGMIGAYCHSERAFRHIATIEWLYVSPRYRRRGIGTALLKNLVTLIQQGKQMKKARLMVNAKNHDAISLYDSERFRRVGLQRREIRYRGRYYDELIMEKTFD